MTFSDEAIRSSLPNEESTLDPTQVLFRALGRLPAPGDNVAIAIRRIEPGTVVAIDNRSFVIGHTILEGHRFAVIPLCAGDPLLSWGLPFGTAITVIAPGDYVCNQSMLEALSIRQIDGASLPESPNFRDLADAFSFDEKSFSPGPPIDAVPLPSTFAGFRRPGNRGVGTRNFIVILGTTSRTASYARQLAERLQTAVAGQSTIDGIVAIAHTEGGGTKEPNNSQEILKTLAGFIVHPNVGAVLAVDFGVEPITNDRVKQFMIDNQYPLADVPHHFLTLNKGMATGMDEGERIVQEWIGVVGSQVRTNEPLSGLRIALQCGGSDAFSGISGNPLAGAMVHELIRHGGIGVLTETDEAVGAEAYILRNVRNVDIARQFLGVIDQFEEYLSWHGVSSESNPSGGNKLRGLYNIALKSVGAVHKKDPRTRLDHVTQYAEPIGEPGFYFMNGPGNDLEGIAGQVAAGCNLILFVTGNGSVTNFPFVPTLKITTTSRRHRLLSHEMDINAGRYLDGESFESLTQESFELAIKTASGRKSKGERAGHSQVSLWRNWPQTDRSQLQVLQSRTAPDGAPIPLLDSLEKLPTESICELIRTVSGFATERVGLVLPTSLCSSQVARLAAERLNERQVGFHMGVSRFVVLPHTEGCGSSGESIFRLLHRSYRGYLTHPNVAAALLLEHGCEKVPNDVMRYQLEKAGVDGDRFGWASVQLDGGIANAIDNIEAWFTEKIASLPLLPFTATHLGALAVGLMTEGEVSETTATAFAMLTQTIVSQGGSVLIPESDSLLTNDTFLAKTVGPPAVHATLAYGQPFTQSGFHVVGSETDHWVENLTGLGACGAHLMLTVVKKHPRQGHPLLAVIQVAEAASRCDINASDVDLILSGDLADDLENLQKWVVAAAERKRVPVSHATGFVDFQFTRGLLGVTS